MNCTPSATIEEKFEDSTSVYAEEGTLAHEFGELSLQLGSGRITQGKYNWLVASLKKHELYSPEMDVEVEKYTDYVMEQWAEAQAKTKGASLLLEEKVDLTEFIEEGFGTCDANIIADGTLEVIDLKYGQGVKVDADDNPQLKLYGLGALYAYDLSYDIKKVRLTIVQPRLNHVSSWVISAKDLMQWGEDVVKPTAQKAFKGEGEQKAGDWCRWCKAKARCSALAKKSTEIAKHAFKDPQLLTDDQVLEVFDRIPMLKNWAKAVEEHMLSEAIKGKKWPGFKLVEGRSMRKWSDEKKAIDKLSKSYKTEEYINAKIKGIGDIEKLVGKGKFVAALSDCISIPQGKPTLVLESDKRPEFNRLQKAKDAFGED